MASITQQSSYAIPQRKDGSFGGKVASPIDYYVAIQIETNAAAGDANIGLYYDSVEGKYFFRWVTGRPGYGPGHPPLGEVDSNSLWAEGIITSLKGISPIIRMIDIIVHGNYGSLSGASFKIKNTPIAGKSFWKYVEDNSYYLINRKVKIYVVLDDYFYQVWGGVVSSTGYNETVYSIECEDDFKNLHKALPPTELNSSSFPNIDPEYIGDKIPVTIGNVLRSKLMNITGKSEAITLGANDYWDIKVTSATAVDVDSTDRIRLEIKTPNGNFPVNHFRDTGEYYLRVLKGGTLQSIRVIDSEATTGAAGSETTKIILAKMFKDLDFATFNSDHVYGSDPVTNDCYFFEIIKMDVYYLTSDKAINGYLLDSLNRYELTRWDSDKKDYTPIPELGLEYDTTETNKSLHPRVLLNNTDLNISGDLTRIRPISPTSIVLLSKTLEKTLGVPWVPTTDDFPAATNSCPLLFDKDNTTNYKIQEYTVASQGHSAIIQFLLTMDTDVILDGLDELFIGWDARLGTSGIFNNYIRHYWTLEVYDPYVDKFFVNANGKQQYPGDASGTGGITGGVNDVYLLADDYYINDTGIESAFGKRMNGVIISDLLKLDSNIIGDFNNAIVGKAFRITLEYYCWNEIGTPSPTNYLETVQLNEIGFYGTQKINLIKDDIFVKIQGEKYGTAETNTVYNGFRHILENYDGISSANIDYGNLATTRDTQYQIGRQITDRQPSSKYLKELAQHSYVGIFPTRDGKRGLKSFWDDMTPTVIFNEDNITKDQIVSYKKSSFTKMYNDFSIKYDWNPGLGKFNGIYFITNVDQSSFPGQYDSTGGSDTSRAFTDIGFSAVNNTALITLSSDPATWAEIGGAVTYIHPSLGEIYFATIINFTSTPYSVTIEFDSNPDGLSGTYTTGTVYSHGSTIPAWTTFVGGVPVYADAAALWGVCRTSYLKTLTVNPFKAECKFFPENSDFGSGYANMAYVYFILLLNWATRLKDVVTLFVPISPQIIELELLDCVTFEDDYYTASASRTGWITKKKIHPGRRQVEIEIVLIPDDLVP